MLAFSVEELLEAILLHQKQRRTAFWVNWSYSYLLLLAGTIMLVLTLFRSSRIYQMQGFVLLFAVSAP